MALRTYQNFDLLLEAADDGGFRARVTTSPLGQSSSAKFALPFGRTDWRFCFDAWTRETAASSARRRWIWVGRCSRVCSPRTSC